MDSADLSQPICTALQVAMVDLLRTWNITPTAVVGHSSGEIAAAYAKGALTRHDAWAIAYHRGHLSHCIRGFAPQLDGSMLAAGVGRDAAEWYISRASSAGNATIACVNSPSSVTISGDAAAVTVLEKLIKDDGHFARKLKIDVAYHSPHMQVIADKYRHALAGITSLPEEEGCTVRMFSSLTGKLVDNTELGPSYWVANMVNQVNFVGATESMLSQQEGKSRRRAKRAFIEHLVEIGPHAALKGPLKQIMDAEALKSLSQDITYQSLLQRGMSASDTALTVAGNLYQIGIPVDIPAVNGGSAFGDFLVDLPPFPWNHSLKFWSESPLSKAHRLRKHPRKDLFGLETPELLSDEPRFRNTLRVNEVPWVQYHKVQGTILYPAAGMMIMAIEAMCSRKAEDREVEGYELRDVIIGKAIVIPDNEDGIETMISLKPFRLGSRALTSVWEEFQVYSRAEQWELNCSGLIRINYKASASTNFDDESVILAGQHADKYNSIRDNYSRAQNPRQFYQHLDSIGLQYGSIFQNLTEIQKGDYWSACKLSIPDTANIMPANFEYPHVIHPVTLDSIIHIALPSYTQIDEDLTNAMVPTHVDRLYVSADIPSSPGTILSGYSQRHRVKSENDEWSIAVANAHWDKPLVIFEGIQCAIMSDTNQGDAVSTQGLRKLATVLEWQPDVSALSRDQIEAICREGASHVVNHDREHLVEAEMACLIFAKRVVQGISLEESESLPWNFKLYYDYLHKHYELGQKKELCYQAPDFNWLDLGEEAEAELLERVAKGSNDGAALVEHGNHLLAILRGETPPLQILMNNNLLHNFYKDGVGYERGFAQLCSYMKLLAHKKPTMKILEIGGGTGGVSLPILEALSGGCDGSAPRLENYTFTDISSGYFEKAAAKLAPWAPFMEFQRLNIEEDPADQGFEAGSYDLIIASNVLHATKSVRRTLEHVRKLLKP